MARLSSLHPQRRSRRRLLLVEDDESVVASLQLFLKSDYEVHSASTVQSGVALFKTLHPSLVVLDLRLTDGSGLEALRQIRRASSTAPVIVLTGYASMRSVEESLRLGASDYLHKPFDGFALKSRIDHLVGDSDNEDCDVAGDDPQSPVKTARRIAELELQAHASSMFLHDAASPVTTALTAANFLCQQIEEFPERYDKDVHRTADLLYEAMGFISGLFEQSRSIECLSKLQTSEVTIHKIVNLAVNLVRGKAQERGITLNVHFEEPEARVCINQFALARVLLNLIRNAVEAVEPDTGKVTLSVTAIHDYVEFTVQDNGPGIAPRLMQKVFEARFTTKTEGTGLGLYICKHLVESMNGTLAVRNEPGQGCRLSIRIPRAL